MAASSGEKPHEPTPKRLRDARKRGEVPKSAELISVGALLGAGLAVVVSAPRLTQTLLDWFAGCLREATRADIDAAPRFMTAALGLWASLAAPVVIAAACLAVGVGILSIGPLFALEAVRFKTERLDPVAGLRRLVSMRGFGEVLRSLAKVTVVGWLAFNVLQEHLPSLLQFAPAKTRVAALGDALLALSSRVMVSLVAFGALDLILSRRAFQRRLRMTHEEVRREHREEDGDPRHKAERKRQHRRVVDEASLRRVARADVVIVNPTHIAVALAYDRASMSAPEVIAKGKRRGAEKIRSLARQHGVPIKQDPPLARALYEIDMEDAIPEALYDAVAEVLRIVYAEKARAESDG